MLGSSEFCIFKYDGEKMGSAVLTRKREDFSRAGRPVLVVTE